MNDKKIPHTESELIVIFKQDNIHEKFYPKFLGYYKVCFDELYNDMKNYEDDDFEEGDSIKKSALWCTNHFIKPYLELIEKGHGEEWAHELARSTEDGERAIYFTHSELESINPDLAKKELQILCKSLGGDEYFEKHYLYLFEVLDDVEGRIEKARFYSNSYKEQIALGKSEVYADKFADYKADGGFHEIYCEEYAFAYDKAITENKNIEYAREYAEKYGSALVDIKRRFGISDDEESIDFAIEKVNAYMNAWEYDEEHQLKDFKRFAEIYENIHLNTYYADGGMPDGSTEEIDNRILIKTLELFNK
ncbi:hypothetical protein ACFX5E_00190 [Flavobacterium sp. LS2P90]|uniref:DUF4375 domain-containing protein n=1 Tax=Flavobacterium xylosi TaxID=3230415 RepID=A0ABW6HRX9_9FLAO